MVWKARKLGTDCGLWAYGNYLSDWPGKNESRGQAHCLGREQLEDGGWSQHTPDTRKAIAGFQAHSLSRSEKGRWEKYYFSSGEFGNTSPRLDHWRYTIEFEGGKGV